MYVCRAQLAYWRKASFTTFLLFLSILRIIVQFLMFNFFKSSTCFYLILGLLLPLFFSAFVSNTINSSLTAQVDGH